MNMTTEGLDELDVRILEALQRNARSTFTELGSLVGLKAPAVRTGSSAWRHAATSPVTARSSTRAALVCS